MEPSIPGPDGYLPSRADPLYAEHLLLNDYLLAEETRDQTRTEFNVRVWKKLPKQKVAAQIEAALRRILWLDEHDAELDTGHIARTRLRTLLRALYAMKVPYTEPNLRAFLDLTTPLLGRIAPYGFAGSVAAK